MKILLVQTLEAGGFIDEAAAQVLIDEVKMKIKSVFDQVPKTPGNKSGLSANKDRGCM